MHRKGLIVKYDVRKVETGELVNNCFVLRPDKDPAAVDALIEYARSSENMELRQDIANWLKNVAGKEGVNYYEIGEGEYVIARSKEEALDFYGNMITTINDNQCVRQLHDLDNFHDGIVLKQILKAQTIPAYTHSVHAI